MSRLRMVGVLSVLLAAILLSAGCGRGIVSPSPVRNAAPTPVRLSSYDITARRDLLTLMMAYPGAITGVEHDGGYIYIVMESGARLVYDDKKVKSYDEMLGDADLQDMLSQVYPLSDIDELMKGDCDPGRIRVYAFFSGIYGKTQDEVRSHLVNVSACSGNPVFSRCGGAAEALGRAFTQVTALIGRDQAVSAFVYPLSGTFNYRDIAGTGRLSMHAYAAAVDLHLNGNDYWRWVPREKGQKRLDAYPRELVRIFEQNGFIWGGKWAHFDLVHYEYRPELIMKAQYDINTACIKDVWYEGFPYTQSVRDAAGLIDEALDK